MIRSKQFVNGTGSKGASRYFTEELSASDYYARGVGQLGGKELWRSGGATPTYSVGQQEQGRCQWWFPVPAISLSMAPDGYF